MIINNISIIVAAILLLAFLCWKELQRANRHRLIYRILFTIIAIVAFVGMAIEIRFPKKVSIFNNKAVAIVTEGTNKDTIKKWMLQHPYADTLSVSQLAAINQASLSNELHVFGYGFAAHEIPFLQNKPIQFHCSSLPTGIINIFWQKNISVGKSLVVQGTANNTYNIPITVFLDAFGMHVDSTIVPAHQKQQFELHSLPKYIGKTVYEIVATTGKDIIEHNPIPFEVVPVEPLKILLLASTPNFEDKFLKNWLYENRYSVVSQTVLSKGKTSHLFLNASAMPNIDNLSPKLLQGFDVIITDAEALEQLSIDQKKNVENVISKNGVSLLIRDDSLYATKERHLFSTQFSIKKGIQNATNNQLSLNNSNTTNITFPAVNPSIVLEQPNLQSVVSIPSIGSVVAVTLMGTGKVALSTLQNTYTLVLQGKKNEYEQLWTTILEKIAPSKANHLSATVETSFPYPQQPCNVLLNGQQIILPPTISISGIQVYLKQNPLQTNQYEGMYWPIKTGWNHILYNNTVVGNAYIYDTQHWKNVVSNQKSNITNLYIAKHPFVKNQANEIKWMDWVLPKIYFFIVFLASMAYLWYERKLQ